MLFIIFPMIFKPCINTTEIFRFRSFKISISMHFFKKGFFLWCFLSSFYTTSNAAASITSRNASLLLTLSLLRILSIFFVSAFALMLCTDLNEGILSRSSCIIFFNIFTNSICTRVNPLNSSSLISAFLTVWLVCPIWFSPDPVLMVIPGWKFSCSVTCTKTYLFKFYFLTLLSFSIFSNVGLD